MSDEEKPEAGSEPPAEPEENKTDGSAEGDPPAEAASDGDKPKRKARRKPVWVCVPTEWEEVAVHDEDGSMHSERQPTRYSLTECPGGEGQKKAILRVLAAHQVDPLNYEGVLMFRADPVEFDIDQQLIIRIKGL